MSTYLVKAGVELPSPKKAPRKSGRLKYPFDAVDVGQLFFVAGTTTQRFSTYAGFKGRLLGKKFRTQTAVMRRDLQTDEWEPCKSTDAGAATGVAVTRLS